MKSFSMVSIAVLFLGLNVSGQGVPNSAEKNPERNRIERLLDITQGSASEHHRIMTTPGNSREDALRNRDKKTSVTEALVAVGDPAIDPIVERIKKAKTDESPDSREVVNALVVVLSQMNTEKADATLLDLALGRNTFRNFSGEPTVVSIYTDMMKRRGNKNACRIFLVNDQGKSYGYALRAIEGVELDKELFDKVCSFLTRDNFRNDALRVLAANPSTRFNNERVIAICDSLIEVEKQRDGNRARKNMLNVVSNTTDQYCVPHIEALTKIPSVDSFIRERIEQQPEGIARQCLLIALGNRGDIAVSRKALMDFLKNQKYREFPVLRSYAVAGYVKGGEMVDLPFLQELATTDPFKEEYVHIPDGPRWQKWGDEYINLTANLAEVQGRYELAKKLNPPERFLTRYPIREAAKKAIEAIEAREKGQAGKEEKK